MEIKSLTGLRGVAALIVLWFHIKAALASRGVVIEMPLLLERLFFSGGHSVDIFFVLSGFILTLTYKDWFKQSITGATYLKYFRRRIARIYPLHFVLLTLTVAAVIMAQRFGIKANLGFERFDYSTLPEHYSLMHAWGIFANNSGAWNPPSWSISIELLAYLLLPLVLYGLARVRSEATWVLILFAVALGVFLNLLTPWADYGFAGISRGLSEFLLGCVTARLLNTKISSALQTTAGSWLSLVALITACAIIQDTGFIIGLCSAPLILAMCSQNAVARFFAIRPIYFLGEISYSLYIGHFLYTLIVWRIVKPEWMAQSNAHLIAGFLAVNGLVIAVSTATYYLIERPGRDFLSDKKRS